MISEPGRDVRGSLAGRRAIETTVNSFVVGSGRGPLNRGQTLDRMSPFIESLKLQPRERSYRPVAQSLIT